MECSPIIKSSQGVFSYISLPHIPINLDKAPKGAGAPERKITSLSPQEIAEFERIFLEWLTQNQEALQESGSGNVEDLTRHSAILATNLKPNPNSEGL